MSVEFPDPPAHVAPYVEALGVEGALALFLSMGGADVYLPKHSTPRSMTARTIGADKVDRLVSVLGYGYYKVPLAKQWCAQVMRVQGHSNAEIARVVRMDVAKVRQLLPSKDSKTQLDLFSETGT
ncbi:helix-turn-helix domain containing protein [Roseibium aggregatum]|jgi:hypothetical protein|uniref:helix-turn-helix domain containing protein n=1 Tax=Roseibium aggregatum TaxID=187304 RepID=UPI001E35F2CA|nr:helix-turn-helix domain containing protein [Roseibium aggregatum]UES58524.1 helix-turn-helix domain containing protein [Roseibium aggregatum]